MRPLDRPLVGLPTPPAATPLDPLGASAGRHRASLPVAHPATLLALALAAPVAWLAYGQTASPLACAQRLAQPQWVDLAALLVWAPWAEEVALRLGVQQPLRAWLTGRAGLSGRAAAVAAALVAALAFACLHLASGPGPWSTRLLAWLVPGLTLAACHALDDRLGRTVALHAWFNACALLACAQAA